MQLLAFSFLPAIISGADIGSRLISSKDANGVLNKGESRGVSGFIEEVFRNSDLERECVEEQCKYEEWLERAENDFDDLRKTAELVTEPIASVRFNDYYIHCYEKVETMKLDEPNLIDFRKECIQTFLKETFPTYFMKEDDENKENYDDDDDTVDHYDY